MRKFILFATSFFLTIMIFIYSLFKNANIPYLHDKKSNQMGSLYTRMRITQGKSMYFLDSEEINSIDDIHNISENSKNTDETINQNKEFLEEKIQLDLQIDHLNEKKNELNFFIFGDYGYFQNETEVMASTQKLGDYVVQKAKTKFTSYDFILSVGDNIYDDGIQVDLDPRVFTLINSTFKGSELGLDWYTVLGNHDCHGNMEATMKVNSYLPFWKQTEPYYHKLFPIGNSEKKALFMFLNGCDLACKNKFSTECFEPMWKNINFDNIDKQLSWLNNLLENNSNNPNIIWKIVVVHWAIFSAGGNHGDNDALKELLLPILLKYKIDLVLSGHDHNVQYLRTDIKNLENKINNLDNDIKIISNTSFHELIDHDDIEEPPLIIVHSDLKEKVVSLFLDGAVSENLQEKHNEDINNKKEVTNNIGLNSDLSHPDGITSSVYDTPVLDKSLIDLIPSYINDSIPLIPDNVLRILSNSTNIVENSQQDSSGIQRQLSGLSLNPDKINGTTAVITFEDDDCDDAIDYNYCQFDEFFSHELTKCGVIKNSDYLRTAFDNNYLESKKIIDSTKLFRESTVSQYEYLHQFVIGNGGLDLEPVCILKHQRSLGKLRYSNSIVGLGEGKITESKLEINLISVEGEQLYKLSISRDTH